jgi:hypothetical protein
VVTSVKKEVAVKKEVTVKRDIIDHPLLTN